MTILLRRRLTVARRRLTVARRRLTILPGLRPGLTILPGLRPGLTILPRLRPRLTILPGLRPGLTILPGLPGLPIATLWPRRLWLTVAALLRGVAGCARRISRRVVATGGLVHDR